MGGREVCSCIFSRWEVGTARRQGSCPCTKPTTAAYALKRALWTAAAGVGLCRRGRARLGECGSMVFRDPCHAICAAFTSRLESSSPCRYATTRTHLLVRAVRCSLAAGVEARRQAARCRAATAAEPGPQPGPRKDTAVCMLLVDPKLLSGKRSQRSLPRQADTAADRRGNRTL